MSRSVWIAGRGAVTPFGMGAGTMTEAVLARESAIAPCRRLRDVDCLAAVAAEFPAAVVAAAKGDLVLFAARMAAEEAIVESGLGPAAASAFVLGTTKADLSGVIGAGVGLGSPARLMARLADGLGVRGPRAAVSCACASGLSALATASRWIASGRIDRALVVGVDVLGAFIMRGFSCLLALDPEPCRPFDAMRRGLSLGEAAGALILTAHAGESLGVRVAGWGGSNDAHHITGPSRDGLGLRLAAERALKMARTSPDQIAYVHLHGTGTPYNDAMEAKAMGTLFDGRSPPASGTKAQTGHTLGAAGLIETIVAMEALVTGRCPGNHRLTNPDVGPELSLLRAPSRLDGAQFILKVAAGFGGVGAAVVLGR